MPRQFKMIFYGPEGTQQALVASGGSPEEGTTHQVALGGPGAPWWVIRPFCIMLLYQYLLHYGLLLHIISQYLWLFSLILQGLP